MALFQRPTGECVCRANTPAGRDPAVAARGRRRSRRHRPRKQRGQEPVGRATKYQVAGFVSVLFLIVGDVVSAQDRATPLPPAEAVARITVPPGFQVSLFAAEPDVRQPIAFTIDDRGRLWVAECYSYPHWKATGNDRIVILEDADGDGRFDRRSVFWDKGANVTGVALGFGGVWVCATPNLLFIPDRNGDDVPDGDPAIVLDGWDLNCRHNAFNALHWGPDGWLYGCNGILSNSLVGAPGTPPAQRVAINCGVWRYHPVRRTFQAVAHGTTNPWGLDFDDYGEMFITNCVIAHLFRVVPGAHFQRMFGEDLNPNLYALMDTCADHLHWGGGHWTDSRGGKGAHSEAGGGHAHAGAMIYLGDNWPAEYRNSLFTCNIHGSRVNCDRLERTAAGYVARHAADVLHAHDEWFRGLELKYGPDGGVFVTDWSDAGECHDYDQQHGVHLESGRIYKVTYGRPRPVRVDLAKLDDAELVALQGHANDWFVRQARRLLHERAAAGRDMSEVHRSLRAMFESAQATPRRLRALWALHVTGATSIDLLARLLDDPDEHIRAWASRLVCDEAAARDPALLASGSGAGRSEHSGWADAAACLHRRARVERAPFVQLYLASALQRMPVEHRPALANALLENVTDRSDPSLQLMLWYGCESLAALHRPAAADLAGRSRAALIRRYLTRRVVSENDPAARERPSSGLAAIARVLAASDDTAIALDLLVGIREALQGQKRVTPPAGWPALYTRLREQPPLREPATILALQFGDADALASLRATMVDPMAARDQRERAVQALIETGTPNLASELHRLLDDAALRPAALRALAATAHDATPREILARYSKLTPAERDDAVATLSSRVSYAVALLDAVEAGTVPSRDLSAFTVRQLQALRNAPLDDKLRRVWGTTRPTARDKAARAAQYRAMLTPDRRRQADLGNGRRLFERTCAQCHRLFGAGGDVGPDLTGSNRHNLDYVLENVLDPSAVVGREFRLHTIATRDGRLVSGIVRERTAAAVLVQTANERVVLATDDIEDLRESNASLMPEGAFDKLTDDEVRDLIGYLASPSQVPVNR